MRHEAHRLVGKEQSPDDSDEAQRRDAEHQKQLAEALELDHQHREHQDEHQRRDGYDRGFSLVALLNGAANVDAVSIRQTGTQCRHLRRQILHDRGGLRAGHGVRLHRHRGPPVPAPDHRIFLAVID